jgi:hypothetical protein
MNTSEITPREHLPLPLAYSDPAFRKCVEVVLETELFKEFDRLFGCELARIGKASPMEQMIDEATGYQEEMLRHFVEFVHDIYTRIPEDAIRDLRLESKRDQKN